MKRYLILITIAFSFFTYSFGQSTTFNDVTKKTTIKDNDGVIVHDVDANYSYGVLWQDVAAYMFGRSNTAAGAFNFTNSITLPSTLDAGLTNGIGFQDGDFAWSDGNGDGLFYGASKAWVLSVIPDSIDISGGDLSGYKTLAGNETVSGINTYTNVNDFRTGTVYMPYKTSYTALIGNQGLSVRSTDGKVIAQTKDASNNKYDLTLASEAWVTANVSVTGLKSTGTQTGITSTLTWSSGTLTPYILDPITLKIKNGTPTVTDEIAYDDGEGETGLYVKTSASTLYIPDRQILDAELKKTDFIHFSGDYPQLNDYQGLPIGFNIQIDSVVCSIESTSGTGTMAFNLWHGNAYSPSIGTYYVFSSTQTITQENTEAFNKFSTGWGDRTIEAGDFFWVKYSTMSETIKKFFITVYYTRL